jgi:hypothetical protein
MLAEWCGAWNGGRRSRPARGGSAPGDRVHRGDLQGLLVGQRRQDRGQSLGEHRLAGTGWPDQEQVVTAGGGQFEPAPAQFLTDHVGQVGTAGWHRVRRRWRVEQWTAAADEVDEQAQGIGRSYRHVRYQSGLPRVGQWYHDPPDAGPYRREHAGQDAPDRAYRAIEPQFTEQHHALQRRQWQYPGPGQDRHRDGQIEDRTVLGQRRRQQVYRDSAVGPAFAGVDQCRPHPVARLVECGVGQAGQREAGESRGEIGLHLHQVAGEAGEPDRQRLGVGHLRTPRADAQPRPRHAAAAGR